MTIGLTALVERYLTERRTLGFQLRSTAYSLRSLAEYVRRTRHRGPLTLEVMAEWARLGTHASVDPRTWARRLKHLRSFARWMQQFEPATEVPDDTMLMPASDGAVHRPFREPVGSDVSCRPDWRFRHYCRRRHRPADGSNQRRYQQPEDCVPWSGVTPEPGEG
jgi:hypothetical protein